MDFQERDAQIAANGSIDMTSRCDYSQTMVRTQIQLTEQQARKVKTTAKEVGVSVAELIRQCVDEGLARRRSSRASLYERAGRWLGSCQDPEAADDLSANHDRYLEEAFG